MGYLNRKLDFEVGSRVRVVTQKAYKSVNLIGECGIVRDVHGSNIRVNLDNMRNTNSSYGSYYFTPGELEIIDDQMEVKTMQNNITNYLNIAKIKFIDNTYANLKTYEYANFDPDLTVGDICVVKSANHGYGVAEVVDIIEQNDITTQREIVARVNIDAYRERLDNRAKAAELKTKMQERVKQLQDIALYKMMAENDPTMSEMLKEYQAVTGI
jgi:hypothetical protein